MVLDKLPVVLRGHIYDYLLPGQNLVVLKEHSRKTEMSYAHELQSSINLAHVNRFIRGDVLSYIFQNRAILVKLHDIEWFSGFLYLMTLQHIRHLHIIEISSGLWSENVSTMNGLAELARIANDIGRLKVLTLSQNPWRAWHFPSEIDFDSDPQLEVRKLLDLPLVNSILAFQHLGYVELHSGDPTGLRISIVEDPSVSVIRMALQKELRMLLGAEQSELAYQARSRRTLGPTRGAPLV